MNVAQEKASCPGNTSQGLSLSGAAHLATGRKGCWDPEPAGGSGRSQSQQEDLMCPGAERNTVLSWGQSDVVSLMGIREATGPWVDSKGCALSWKSRRPVSP